MSHLEKQYYQARDAWITARKNYKRNLNNLGRHQNQSGQMKANERGFEWHFNYVHGLYQPVAKRYLEALKAYARERPELRGRLMYDLLNEAAVAQSTNQNDVSDQYLKSVENLAVENVKIAHSDWVRNGNQGTMAAVFVSVADAQLSNADQNSQVKKIAQEVFDCFREGKVKRDRREVPVTPSPKIPKSRRGRQQPIWIYKTIDY